MYLVDSHCHLDYFEKGQVDELIKNCKEDNIKFLQTISTKISEFEEKIIPWVKKYSNIYCSYGNHPCNVQDEKMVELESFVDYITQNKGYKIIGIGETGLDYYHSTEYKDLQKKHFEVHIEASIKTQKPVIVHTRDATDDTLDMLSYYKKQQDFPVLIHCFTGDKEFTFKLLDLDCYISYSGIVTFKNAKEIQESCINTPINRLLVETDAPFLAPMPHRGKQNQPAYVKYVAQKVAEFKNITQEEVAIETSNNFLKLFNLSV